MNIGFIGFGHMAKAIAHGLLQNPKYTLWAAAPSLTAGTDAHGIHTHFDNHIVAEQADVIILAVKPVQMKELWEQVAGLIAKNKLVISVATGVSLSWFNEHSQISAVVRAMPNIATSVSQGATALFANERVTEKQKLCADEIFANNGITVWLEKENEMDICTALSGSGPAYIFLFMDAMIQAASSLGLSEKLAHVLTLQTVQGALSLARQKNEGLTELRRQVTSPGGTTAAAVEVLQHQGFEALIFAAMKAAYNRAQELETLISAKK